MQPFEYALFIFKVIPLFYESVIFWLLRKLVITMLWQIKAMNISQSLSMISAIDKGSGTPLAMLYKDNTKILGHFFLVLTFSSLNGSKIAFNNEPFVLQM